MKKIIMLFVAIAIMAGFSMKVLAQPPAVTAKSVQTAKAEILSAISINPGTTLEFGGIASPTAAGTVIVATTGVRTQGVDANVPLLITGILPTAATYTVGGTKSTFYTIGLPNDDQVTLTCSTGGTAMRVTSFVCSYSTNTSKLSSSGTDNFSVGATLNVGASQIAGTYTGPFDVTVAY